MFKVWIKILPLIFLLYTVPSFAQLGPSQAVIICDVTAANCVNITNNGLNTNANVTIVSPYTTSSTPLEAQQAVTVSAVALPSNSGKMACVKVLLSGTQNVYVGGASVTTATGWELAPGDSTCWAITNSNILYVIASNTGSTVSVTVLP
jgi:hypothetical protein